MLAALKNTAGIALGLARQPASASSLRRAVSTSATLRIKDRPKVDPTKDYYSVLGLVPDATQTEVREAFYSAARRLHPDVNPTSDATKARAEFDAAREAFAVLRNPESRREYDEKAGVERSADARAEDVEVHWMARTQVGPRKVWSEKLYSDMLLASALRVKRRRMSAANEAADKRKSWIRKGLEVGDEPVLRKPRTLKEQIDWEESYFSRTRLNIGETPEGGRLKGGLAAAAGVSAGTVALWWWVAPEEAKAASAVDSAADVVRPDRLEVFSKSSLEKRAERLEKRRFMDGLLSNDPRKYVHPYHVNPYQLKDRLEMDMAADKEDSVASSPAVAASVKT